MADITGQLNNSLQSAGNSVSANVPKLPATPKLPEVPKLKGSIPTKIDLNTGQGVPGGYSAASIQPPASVTKTMNSNLAAIAAKKAELANSTLDPVKKLEATKKLDDMQKKAQDKLKDVAKAPDFTKKYKLPAAPKMPEVPDFKSMGIPDLPAAPKLPSVSLPSVPKIPSVPSIPKIPSIGGI